MDRPFTQRPSSLKWFQEAFLSGSAFLFWGLMLGNAIAYVYQMLMARMMSPEQYGVLVTLTSISYVLSVLMRTFQAWIIKAVASRSDPGRARAVFAAMLVPLASLGSLAFLGHWLFASAVADFLHLDATLPVIVLGVYTFSSFLVPAPRGVLMGLNRLYIGGAIHVLEPLARLAAGVALVYWGFGANGAIAGFALGNLLAFVIALVPLWPLLAEPAGLEPRSAPMPWLDRYAVLMLAVNACLMIVASVDQVAIKHYFSEQVAGNYAVAFLLGRVISMTTLALGWVIFTRAATMQPDDPGHARVLLKGLLVMGVIALSLNAGYLIAPGLAVRLMGGTQYGTASGYVGLVGIEMTLFAFVYIQAYYLISIKRMQIIWPLLLGTVLEGALLMRYHSSVQQVLYALIGVMSGLLVCVSGIAWWSLRAHTRRISIPGEALAAE
jgi:O-antigen/teichoic acid export membrane protein